MSVILVAVLTWLSRSSRPSLDLDKLSLAAGEVGQCAKNDRTRSPEHEPNHHAEARSGVVGPLHRWVHELLGFLRGVTDPFQECKEHQQIKPPKNE